MFDKQYISTSYDIPHYRNLFNGQEADNEVYGNGAVLGYEFRQYDSRIGRWWSIDPLADKYPGVGPYVFCADSPMMLVDPSGKDAWKPEVDAKGNILAVAEPGDNQTTLRKFMGPAYSDKDIHDLYEQLQNGHINLTESIGGVFQLMTDAINDARRDPYFENNKNYNCWGAAIAITSGKRLYGDGQTGVGIGNSEIFDNYLRKNYIQINPEDASVGKTVLRFGKPEEATHAAVYMGMDNNGTEYVFTKNGWKSSPIISTIKDVVIEYGQICGKRGFFDEYGTVYSNNGYYNHIPFSEKK